MQEAQFILFLDPETKQFYSFCEEKGILVLEKAPSDYEEIINDDLHIFNHIMKWDKKKKIAKSSSFQSRPIPVGYLAPRKFRFPVYSFEEPIKEASLEQIKLNNDGSGLLKGQFKQSISMRIYFGSIRQQILIAKQLYNKINTEYIDKSTIRLITSPNEIIRTVCRKILTETKIVITTKTDTSRLILKVRNREEYLFGNQPISYYQHIIECLKEDQMVMVEIIDTEINLEKEQFQKFVFYRNISDIQKGDYLPFPWDKRSIDKHSGFLMWYRPDAYYLDREVIEQLQGEQLERANQLIKNKIENRRKNLRKQLPRYILKQNIEKFVQFRRKEIEKKLVSIEGSTIFSGQCNFGYSFKVTGIKNLYSLFVLKNSDYKLSKRNILKFTSSKDSGENMPRSLSTSYHRYNQVLKYKQREGLPFIPYQMNISVEFYHNGESLYEQTTDNYLISNIIHISDTITWKSRLADLMLQSSLIFKVRIYSKEGENIICGTGLLKLFDEYGFLKQGDYQVQLYAHDKINNIKLGCYHNKFGSDPKLTTIYVTLPKFRKPVRWTLNDPVSMELLGYVQTKQTDAPYNVEQKMAELNRLINFDPLKMLKYTSEQRKLLREGKKYYKHQSHNLVKYLYAVDWSNSLHVAQAYQALKDWSPLKPLQALFLLTPRITDEKVRYFAVKVIDKMKNNDFCLYSNQITQALVSFQTHDNPLIDLIIERCCIDPFTVGQQYFWQFWNKKEESITDYRFNLYLQTLILTSPIRESFFKQIRTYKTLVLANAELVKETKDMYFFEKDTHFRSKCKDIQEKLLAIDPQGFSFPIRPQIKFKHLIKEQSRMFDSKKLPFALCCGHDPEDIKAKRQKPYKVMFKFGDDIKQDHLILQILTVFQKIWIDAGFDLKMNIYRALSTDIEMGFIEIVDDADNSSKIHKDYSQKIMEALDDQSTYLYLKKWNGENIQIARENFIRSSAAYLVATYVLGIGDRHSGNYMIQRNGKFFHIDFGHILGDFKMKLGVKRQRTPFVFTSQFAYAMGGSKSKHFARFQRYCSNAYNLLRKHSNTLINLMAMMVGAQIPNLQFYENMQYMVDRLNLEMSELQAEEHLIKEIKKTLESESRKYDNFFHEKMRFD